MQTITDISNFTLTKLPICCLRVYSISSPIILDARASRAYVFLSTISFSPPQPPRFLSNECQLFFLVYTTQGTIDQSSSYSFFPLHSNTPYCTLNSLYRSFFDLSVPFTCLYSCTWANSQIIIKTVQPSPLILQFFTPVINPLTCGQFTSSWFAGNEHGTIGHTNFAAYISRLCLLPSQI